MAAALLRSDLDIPTAIAKFLSLYLLFSIGFKGGVALAENPFGLLELRGLFAAMVLASVVPIYVFFALRSKLGNADAAAAAATYGSISAVTFVTATAYLDELGIEWSGYMVAAMALMESPAIILGILLYNYFKDQDQNENRDVPWGEILREACLNGSVFLVLGSLVIGWISGPKGMEQLSAFVVDPFTGILCLFLLDMGIVAAKRFGDLSTLKQERGASPVILIITALALPLVNGSLSVFAAWVTGLSEGDALLLVVLGASASYIAVPAAMRLSLPEANPSVYLPMSLTITFPFNIIFGIPLYHWAVTQFA